MTRTPDAASVRDADPKWGCAYGDCVKKARFVVTGSNGDQWGACARHLKEVRPCDLLEGLADWSEGG